MDREDYIRKLSRLMLILLKIRWIIMIVIKLKKAIILLTIITNVIAALWKIEHQVYKISKTNRINCFPG